MMAKSPVVSIDGGAHAVMRVGDRKMGCGGGAWRRGCLSAIAVMLAVPALPVMAAPTEFVVPGGAVITIQDGRVIDGHVVDMDQTNLIIRTSDGVEETVLRSAVDHVAFETVAGRKLIGELVGWANGVYQIATAKAAIKVYSSLPAPAFSAARAVLPEAAGDLTSDGTGGNLAEALDLGSGDRLKVLASDQADAAAETAIDANIDQGVIESQDAAVSPNQALNISVSVEHSEENGPPVIFNVALSRPSESSVVLIYATIDGTAVDGEDYEANRGVLVIKPGERTARIEAPVIDDSKSEGQEHLKLFLTVDPTVATVDNSEIVATIDDDDQG